MKTVLIVCAVMVMLGLEEVGAVVINIDAEFLVKAEYEKIVNHQIKKRDGWSGKISRR